MKARGRGGSRWKKNQSTVGVANSYGNSGHPRAKRKRRVTFGDEGCSGGGAGSRTDVAVKMC